MDILEAAKDSKRVTNLANRASVNYMQLQKNLEVLVDKGFLKLDDETKLYETTKSGKRLLKHWKKMLRILRE